MSSHLHLAVTRSLTLAAIALGLTAVLSGCGTGVSSGTGSSSAVAVLSSAKIAGVVHGGQNAIVGATVQLYTVGTSGLKSASTGLISPANESLPGQTVTSSTGSFNIGGLYNACAGSTPGTEVYITATGGNAGGNSINSDLALGAALGDCVTLYNAAQAGTVNIVLNEATTVAAAYALAPFASDYLHIGASGNEPIGLQNAFANAALLANNATGSSPGANLATGVSVPVQEIYTLANILAACVNSSGGAPGDTSACGKLLGATNTANTFDAAIQIAKNPGAPAIIALWSLPTGQVPFNPALVLSSAPNDFTVAATFTGNPGTLATPFGIALDSAGNAWVTNESATNLSRFTPSGAQINISPAGLVGAQGIAVDKGNNVWVANTAGNSVVEIPNNLGTASSFTAGGISAPAAIAVDSANNIWVANFNGNSVTELSNAGAALNGSPLTANGNITVPSGITIGKSAASGAVYVTTGSGGLVKLANATGAYVGTITDGTQLGPVSAATDPVNGYILSTGFTTGAAVGPALSEFAADSPSPASPAVTGIANPAGVASDGASIWVANSGASGSLSQLTYGSATPVSPTAGFGSLNTPIGVAVDASGSVWTANSGGNSVSKFIGLAAPVSTPLAANVGP